MSDELGLLGLLDIYSSLGEKKNANRFERNIVNLLPEAHSAPV
jgi:hypothetical protein